MEVLFLTGREGTQGWRGLEASSPIVLESQPQKCDKKLTGVEFTVCMHYSKNSSYVNSLNPIW